MSWKPSDHLPDYEPTDYSARRAELRRLIDEHPFKTVADCVRHMSGLFREAFGDRWPLHVVKPLSEALSELLYDESVYLTRPPVVEELSADAVKYMLHALRPEHLRLIEREIVDYLRELAKMLPDSVYSSGKPMATVPLSDLISDPWSYFNPTFLAFASSLDGKFPLFATFNDQVIKNLADLYGDGNIPHDKQRRKPLMELGKPASQIIRSVYRRTKFDELFDTPVPFEIPTHRFGAHGIILAPPEHGKTQLLSTFIARFLSEDVGIVVLDPHGDLFKSLKGKVPPERLIVLDPSTNPPPLNVFDFGGANEVQILQAFTYLMAALTGGMSEKQGAIIPYLLKLLRSIDGATVETLLELVTERLGKNDVSKFMPAVQKLPPLDRDFFVNQFFGKMQETKDAIAWKLSSALSYDAFRAMFTAKTNSFDAFKAMEEKKVVLVKGSESVLGEHGLPVFLQFIVAQFFLAALKRDQVPENKRSLCILFADEASHVFNSQTTRILTECRKYRLGFFAATQVIQQIPQDVKAAIYGATAIKIAGPVAHTDAMLLAREMYTTPETIRSCKSYRGSHAEWMFYVSNVTDHAVKVSVPFGALDELQPVAPEVQPTARETQPSSNLGTKECPFRERDIIQVTIGGYDHYPEGVRVRKIYPEEEILFVDGSESGVPFKDCHHFKPKPKEEQSPPEEPPRPRFTPP